MGKQTFTNHFDSGKNKEYITATGTQHIRSFFKKFSNVSTTVQAATKTATCTHISSKVVTSTTTSSVS